MAGTSVTSVSRVMNDTGYPVSADLRQRILSAIEQLNYTPNSAAQGLRSTFNAVIGIIVRDISNAYFGEIARGATDAALARGHLSFICDTGRNPVNEFEIHELLWKHRVRGIVLAGGGFDTEEYRDLIQRQLERSAGFGLRVVATAPQGVEIPGVSPDFCGIAGTVVDHFMDYGHRRVALVTGPLEVLTSRAHVKGFREAVERHGEQLDPEFIVAKGFTEEAGYAAGRALVARADRPTALCCANDLIAIGAMHAIHDAGLSIPEDVSVAGIGDATVASYTRPGLTSVRVPRYDIGARAVEMVLAEQAPTGHSHLPSHLVSRGTVGPPPRRNGAPVSRPGAGRTRDGAASESGAGAVTP